MEGNLAAARFGRESCAELVIARVVSGCCVRGCACESVRYTRYVGSAPVLIGCSVPQEV